MSSSEINYDPKQVKILVVDDHELIRKSIIKVLRKKGFDVFIECSNGTEAIETLQKQSIDIVFCDLYMTKGGGFDVLNAIRSSPTNDDVPVIIVTGEAAKDDIVKVVDLGADDYMLKPFQTEELERKTQKALHKYFNPTPLLFHIRKAERSCQLKEFGEAMHFVEKALKIDSRSARANHIKSLIVYESGDVKEAMELLRKNIKDSPNFLKNYITAADINLALGNTDESIKFLCKEVELNPKNVRRQIVLAQLLHKQGDFAGAIEHFRQALVENPKAKAALFGMGLSYAEADNIDKAFYYFKRARRAYGDYTKPLEAIVKYGLDKDKAKPAEYILRDEKKSNPKRIDTYVVLAKLLVALDRREEAISTLDGALKVSPDLPELLQLKGSIQLRSKMLAESIETFKQLVKVDNSPNAVFLLVEALSEAQDYKGAIQSLQKILRFKKTRGLVAAHLALSFAKEKELTKALFTYKVAQLNGNVSPKISDATVKVQDIIQSRRLRVKSKELEDSEALKKDKAS